MLVVDTNVVAYVLISGDKTGQARELLAADPEWHTDEYLMVEFTNVLATYVRQNYMTLPDAQIILKKVTGLLGARMHSVSHEEVLQFACKYKVSGYDARYLTVAETVGRKLVTEDKKLLAAAPDLTQNIEEALSNLY